MNSRSLDAALPGHPSRRLVKLTRSILRRHGIIPQREQWFSTWQWARNIATSYMGRPLWPTATEICAMYALVLLQKIRGEDGLKLPYRGRPSEYAHAIELAPVEMRPTLSVGPLALPPADEAP